MKIQLRWQLMLALGLVLLTNFLLYIHFFVFGDPEQTLAFLGTKIVFLPLQVLFITLVVQQLLVVCHTLNVGNNKHFNRESVIPDPVSKYGAGLIRDPVFSLSFWIPAFAGMTLL